ncbi:response regulator transcription factor [Streptomyces olivaceiscleroticus]|uniref:Response regulator transcription factor n=1 Tax=Streptomyces olivaceiscleroticus TaxID=68245 RepID=A0ABN0ZIY3_9ACTN
MIAEDSALLREGLARLLADEAHEVTAAVGDAEALLTAVAGDPPQVVVVDVRMPPTHTDEGLRAALEIRRRWPGTAVLVLSQYVEGRYATELLGGGSGGVGYLLKDRVMQVEEFLDALERVGRGGTAFDPEVVRRLLARSARTDPLQRLTARERDVLELMAQGCTNVTIAERLHVSRSAVEKHINAIFDKLGLYGTTGYSRRVLAVLRHLSASKGSAACGVPRGPDRLRLDQTSTGT